MADAPKPPPTPPTELSSDLTAELERQAEGLSGLPSGSDAVAQFEWLINTLIMRKQIPDTFRRLISKVRGIEATHTIVRLTTFNDKYEAIPSDVPCAENMPICQARCCTFKIPLTKQDVIEGKLPWVIERPYMMPKDRDHRRCTLISDTGGCTVYEVRPAVCRTYDCREDKRVWLDYENRVPAPMVDVDGAPIPDLPATVRARESGEA